jgi:hypothetical protein
MQNSGTAYGSLGSRAALQMACRLRTVYLQLLKVTPCDRRFSARWRNGPALSKPLARFGAMGGALARGWGFAAWWSSLKLMMSSNGVGRGRSKHC